MWGTELTSVMTGEGQAAVFVAVDHCSAECVGLHASRGADRFEALSRSVRACAERFIRVLKENLLWVRRFDTIEELRLALLAFKQTYNQSWIIERHGYKTPAQVRAEQIGQLPMAVEAQIDVPQLWTGTNALYPPCAYANSPAMRYGAPATLGSTLPSRVAV